MADKKSVGHAYNIDFLNVVFAASGLFLFFSSIWMVWDDYDREWKGYQRQFVLLETEVTQAGLAAAEADVDQAELTQLESDRAQAEQELASNQAQIDELEGQLGEIEAELYGVNQDYLFTKAEYDAERYEFEELQEEDPERAATVRPEIDEMYQNWLDLGLEVEDLNAQRDGVRSQIAEYTARMADIDTEIGTLTFETSRLQTRLADLAPSVVDDYLLNAPLLDFMAPTITVQQVITPGIVDDVNFTRVVKMDRCTSCHLSIDLEGYEEYPQPFTTHPNLSAYIGSASPHPLGEFGCTVCHEGMGQSINFEYASHTPSNPDQMHEWEGGAPLGGASPVGLPDAAHRHDRGVMREVPPEQCLRARGSEDQLGLWSLRARRLLRVSYDQGFYRPAKARAGSHEDRCQADRRVGGQLDSRSARSEAQHVDAAHLV